MIRVIPPYLRLFPLANIGLRVPVASLYYLFAITVPKEKNFNRENCLPLF